MGGWKIDGQIQGWPDKWGQMDSQTGQWAGRQTDRQTAPLSLPRHNDLPWQLLKRFNNQLKLTEANLTLLEGTHTNIPKLRSGHVGGQVGRRGGHAGWAPARVAAGTGPGSRC